MASPEWFFSTLAQSSAAIIGFVLAFSAVLHQLERQHREKRTDRLRDELIEFQEKYIQVILDMTLLLSSIEPALMDEDLASFEPDGDPDNPENYLNSFVDNPHVSYPRTAVIHSFMSDIWNYLNMITADADPKRDYLLTRTQFSSLLTKIRAIDNFVQRESETGREIFDELNVGWPDNSHPRKTEVFGEFDKEQLEERESASQEERYAANIGDWLKENIELMDVNYSGKAIRSIMLVIGELRTDFDKINSHTNNTLLDYESTVGRNIIKGSAFLALTGVFIPISLLLTLPKGMQIGPLSGESLTIVQLVVLSLSAFSTAYLLFIILKNLDSSRTGQHLTEQITSRNSE